jgi:purine-binding chemotaxis protein CheW
MDQQVVVFKLADEHYGINITAVDSIIELQAITVVPQAPAFVEGVIRLRGNLLPVVDLRKRFGLKIKDYSKDSRIIVVSINASKIGMIVDAVLEILYTPEETVDLPHSLVETTNDTLITGILKVKKNLIILLDFGKVLNQNEFFQALKIESIPS